MSNLRVFLLIAALSVATDLFSQRERQVPPPDDSDYGAGFFDQLRTIFGRFRDADLKRVFQAAKPSECAELVTEKGEWHEVAFFNENRKLGDWYKTSLEELKNDLSLYIFKGVCGGQRRPVQVTTKFPVDESIKAYEQRRIRFQEIDINVNAPVSATFDSETQSYQFDLPFLFRVTSPTGDPVYTLNPRRLSDRYATDATNRWQCKSVRADDLTYRFLICHTTLVARGTAAGGRQVTASFGSSAYSILSDGKEAFSSVKLTFDEAPESKAEPKSEPKPEPGLDRQPTPRTWRAAASQSRLSDIGQGEFRLRFVPASWKDKIGKPQWIANGTIVPAAPRTGDSCAWRPGTSAATNELLDASPSDATVHTLEFRKEDQSTIAAVFEIQNDAGVVLGVLQCSFRQVQTPADVLVTRWLSVVGSNVTLEAPAQ